MKTEAWNEQTFYCFSNFDKIFNIMSLMTATFLEGWVAFNSMSISEDTKHTH